MKKLSLLMHKSVSWGKKSLAGWEKWCFWRERKQLLWCVEMVLVGELIVEEDFEVVDVSGGGQSGVDKSRYAFSPPEVGPLNATSSAPASAPMLIIHV